MDERTRLFLIPMLVLGMWLSLASAAVAEDVQMRLRGTEQTFPGELLGFDGKSYYIQTQLFGKVYFDAEKYECIAGACPQQETAQSDEDTERTPKSDRVQVSPAKSRPALDMSQQEKDRLFQQFLEWRSQGDN